MSHELRTPLNAILGFSEIIARECLGPVGSPRYKEYAGDIHTSGSHLLSLINDPLDVAKIEAGRMEVEPQMIETGRVLDGALKFVGPKARERNQVLTISVDDAAAVLFADERALKQIVINLVTNSVKFTRDGGKIDVAARRNEDGDFELTVTDNGAGVPKEKLDRIFKPFSRVDNRYDSENAGTGLGLSLVRGLAGLHGGRAWMESELGKGSRVHVVFPMSAAEQRSRRRARLSRPGKWNERHESARRGCAVGLRSAPANPARSSSRVHALRSLLVPGADWRKSPIDDREVDFKMWALAGSSVGAGRRQSRGWTGAVNLHW